MADLGEAMYAINDLTGSEVWGDLASGGAGTAAPTRREDASAPTPPPQRNALPGRHRRLRLRRPESCAFPRSPAPETSKTSSSATTNPCMT